MKFRELISRTAIRYIILAIVLGAIGSGVWEWIVKPSLMGVSHFGLNLATLGVKGFKNSLYQEIARGLHEEPGLRLYIVVCSLLPTGVLGFLTSVVIERSRKQSAAPTLYDRVMLRMGKPLLILIAALLIISIIQANQLAYVNRAIVHFNQLLTITAPYMSEDTRLAYRSQFAQVASAEDYTAVVEKLDHVCRAKRVRCPTFSVW